MASPKKTALPRDEDLKTMKAKPPATKTKAARQDDQVMSTNNSSIVSKRSVEKIYYPHEPHFFRYFVKKYQRRAPLINRGYHLRLHLIDCAVRDFLRAPLPDGRVNRVVVNLGCGSDVLPWQCLTRYPDDCAGALFVDIDFPDLVRRKRNVVLETPELKEWFTPLEVVDDASPILLRSQRYVQVGCDLRDIPSLEKALSSVVDIKTASFLFVAEVSITYMETEGADAVIQWASGLGDSNFCLLEQILPDGPQNPFASTMIKHFQRLNTPLKSIEKYQTQQSQVDRFREKGWGDVECWTLWDAWGDDRFLTAEQRRKLDLVEPFDEWEEFALFGSHYVMLLASTWKNKSAADKGTASQETVAPLPSLGVAVGYSDKQATQRRFGASMVIKDVLGRNHVANTFGMGTNDRPRSIDTFGPFHATDSPVLHPCGGPSARLCHALTDLGDYGVLLSGGRLSPSAPMNSCWVFEKSSKSWRRTQDLPVKLFRHSAVRLGESSLALVFGGKTGPATVFEGCLMYHPEKGWVECRVEGAVVPVPVFGAAAYCEKSKVGEEMRFRGLLAGGVSAPGTIVDQVVRWELDVSDLEKPILRFEELSDDELPPAHRKLIARFGASFVRLDEDSHALLGGVIQKQLLRQDCDILVLASRGGTSGRLVNCRLHPCAILDSQTVPRPLVVGACSTATNPGQILVIGGGATCFSMGTFWTKGSYTFRVDLKRLTELRMMSAGSVEVATPELIEREEEIWVSSGAVVVTDHHSHGPSRTIVGEGAVSTGDSATPTPVTIPRVKVTSAAQFAEIVKQGKPVVIEGTSLGPCTTAWTPEYMVKAVGADRQVSVHESQTEAMDFNTKNFRYVTKSFGEYVQELEKGGKVYLRALSSTEPTARAANLQDDFPNLAGDFVLPPELVMVEERLFSSVLRMSGPVNMWLHYDVMANVYCQVRGSKRFLLFPPTDVGRLHIAPGGSSSSVDVFAGPAPAGTNPHEATMGPGDVLFLPPLWLHAATPVDGKGAGVAVNVFFRDLEEGVYAAGRDVYGNRDLAAYERARRDVARMVKGFDGLDEARRGFYLERLAGEIREGMGVRG